MKPQEQDSLMRAAKDAATRAYAPYSQFRVGAAVLGKSGKIYTGANVENESYGLSICAERVALATAKVAGEENILGIAVVCIPPSADMHFEEVVPCGACLQWIKELAPEAEIVILNHSTTYKIEDFLPHAFQLPK